MLCCIWLQQHTSQGIPLPYKLPSHHSVQVSVCTLCRLMTGKTARNGRMGLDGLGPKLNGPDELGKRLRRKKRARVASPQPDARSQSNSNGPQSSATVCIQTSASFACCHVYTCLQCSLLTVSVSQNANFMRPSCPMHHAALDGGVFRVFQRVSRRAK